MFAFWGEYGRKAATEVSENETALKEASIKAAALRSAAAAGSIFPRPPPSPTPPSTPAVETRGDEGGGAERTTFSDRKGVVTKSRGRILQALSRIRSLLASRVVSGQGDPTRPVKFENLLTRPDPTRPDPTRSTSA